VAFYGDNILSRACHDDTIVMWRIEGFSSKDPPPRRDIAPTTYDPSRLTRSAFTPAITPQCPSHFTRIMEFATPGCGPMFFMRFKLHFVPGQHTILAFGNAAGKVFFWDLERITSYYDFRKATDDPTRDKTKAVQRPGWLQPIQQRQRGGGGGDQVSRLKEASDRDSPALDAETAGGLAGQYSKDTVTSWESKYNCENPHAPLSPHKVEVFGASTFVGRQVAWSPRGEWCIAVGSSNYALVMQRWQKRDAERKAEPS
jgi:polycomb protein EED